jgi:hypothetical protein
MQTTSPRHPAASEIRRTTLVAATKASKSKCERSATQRSLSTAAGWQGTAGDPAGAATALANLLTDVVRVLGPDHPDTRMAQAAVEHWRRQISESAT